MGQPFLAKSNERKAVFWVNLLDMSDSPQASPAEKNNSNTMLVAESLFCERDDRILFQHLNFELTHGQVLQIKGNNGSGKTTLLRILCGINDSYEGAIFWYGHSIRARREEFFSELLYIGHRVGVNKILTPMENLRWSCNLQRSVADQDLRTALSAVGLRGFEDSQCFALSAGQQQRVSLARLLVSKAKLWVLDEPFTTLDVEGVALLERLIAEHAENGGAVLVTTHHPLTVPQLQTLFLGQLPEGESR
ncbi:MAG: cytochrome c biogenesis heme-transporting ATPase CcmA [Gammaproteobacteria bacterium]